MASVKENSKIEQSLKAFTDGAIDIVERGPFTEKLKDQHSLRVKVGYDPTSADLHVGHLVTIIRLSKLQKLGHKICFIVGDFTALIGDPSGRNVTRPALSPKEINKNALTYQTQVAKFLDIKKTELQHNSKWLSKLPLSDFIRLSAKYSLARMLERDDFSKRLKENQAISCHEILYPLLQGYDSIAISADVEMGGSDQLFNLLVGRELQRRMKQDPQTVITFPLLPGLDGKQKMSKSLGNTINLVDSADQVYGKAMSLNDEVMWQYLEVLSTLR